MNSFQSIIADGEYILLQFLLPKTFSLPPSLLTATPEDMETFFLLTAQTLQHHQETIQNSLTDDLFKERKRRLESEHLQEISRIRKELETEHFKEIQSLRKTLMELETATRDEKRNLESAYEKQIKTLRTETAELQGSLTSTRVAFESLQKQIQERVTTVSEEATRRRQELLETTERHHAEKLEVIERKNKEILATKDSILDERETKLRELEEKLKEKFAIQNNSSRKGASGEADFKTLVEQYTPWNLNYTGNKDHLFDYISNIYRLSVGFEIKNYTNDVTTKEVTKFLRDLRENPEIQVGVFLSFHTNIVGKTKDDNNNMLFEWTNQHQLTIYISQFLKQDIGMMFGLLDQILKVVGMFHEQIKEHNNDEIQRVAVLENRINETKRYLENALLRMKNMTYRFTQDKKQQIERIQENYEFYIREIKQESGELGMTIQNLLGLSMDEESPPTKIPEVLPTQEKKPKSRKKHITMPSSEQ
jgi:uncharacterized protein YpuA (DUF1002 family)